MLGRPILLAAGVAAVFAGAARAEMSDADREACMGGSLPACTKIANDRGNSNEVRGNAYSRIVNIWLEKGDLDRAIGAAKRQIEIAPDDASGHNGLCFGRALAHRDLEEALTACDDALSLKPDNPDALDTRGFLLLVLGRYADAMSDFSKALRGHPGMASSLLGRGIAKQKFGDRKGGSADLEAARKRDPKIEAYFARYGIRAE